MSTHDLRRKAQRLSDLRRRHNAHESLSPNEMAELRIGITDEEEIAEYRQIIDSIRAERRNAAPVKKTRITKEKREQEQVQPELIDIFSFTNDSEESND